MLIVDPPTGWKYGFPKPLDHDPKVETFEAWMLRNGYPQELIDQGMLKYCRFIGTDKEIGSLAQSGEHGTVTAEVRGSKPL